jgi:hypothetical protein
MSNMPPLDLTPKRVPKRLSASFAKPPPTM